MTILFTLALFTRNKTCLLCLFYLSFLSKHCELKLNFRKLIIVCVQAKEKILDSPLNCQQMNAFERKNKRLLKLKNMFVG